MRNVGEQAEVQRAEAAAKSAAAERAVIIRVLCSKRESRNFLWWILEQGSPYSSAMRRDESGRGDPMSTAYAAGWHDLGALVMQEIMRADPEGYVMMLRENRNLADLEKMKENENERKSDD